MRFSLAVCLMALGLNVAFLNGAEISNPKVAVLDIERCVGSYQKAKDLESLLQKDADGEKVKASEMMRAYDMLKSEYSIAAPEKQEALVDKIRDKENEIKSHRDQSGRRLKEAFSRMSLDIYRDIKKVVKELSEKENLDLVLKKAEAEEGDEMALMQEIRTVTVLYNSKRLDVTDKVVELLNNSYAAEKKTKP